MIFPEKLKIGDKIGIISTARKITLVELAPAIKTIESWELKVELGPNIFEVDNQFSGTLEQRSRDLQTMKEFFRGRRIERLAQLPAATAGAVETTTISGEAEMQREGGSTTPPVGAKSDSESEPEPGVGAGADADADADAEIEAAPLLPTVAELAKLVNRGRTAQVKLPALRSVETRL